MMPRGLLVGEGAVVAVLEDLAVASLAVVLLTDHTVLLERGAAVKAVHVA